MVMLVALPDVLRHVRPAFLNSSVFQRACNFVGFALDSDILHSRHLSDFAEYVTMFIAPAFVT